MHKQHPQTAYRKYVILIGTIFEYCDKNKPLSNIQQAQFSIGWRFCPVCGHKLYQKDESCSGTIRIKCLKCGNVATVDLAYRRR